jgi:signal transduction histidine kinase
MQPAASEVRRRARYHALRGTPPAEVTQATRRRRLIVLLFQLATLALLVVRGFPGQRLAIHAGICVFYLLACRYPAPPIGERTKIRILLCGLLSYGAWLANTGGLCSPLLPMGLGLLSPALLIFETGRQRALFAAGALGLLGVVGAISWGPAGALVPPLAPHDGHPSPEYLLIAVAAIVVTAIQVTGFWASMTAAYDAVALELGTRREQLCSLGEDRTRELEGAAAHLAHEMKNPLASIKCLSVHLARGCSLDPRTVARLEVVSAAADRLEAIVDGFLSLSRGLGELEVEATRPHQAAAELKLLLEVRAREAGVSLEVVGQPDLELQADGRKLQRALFYLIMNAVQASRPGQTVTIEARAGTAGTAQVKVIDRGEGMSAETLERLKHPPFSGRPGGAGLGVAVARTLVEMHGGSLTFESAPGRGTTATIQLPHRPPARAAIPRLVPEALRDPAQAG